MTQVSSSGATIRLFLVDGTPQGVRLVDRSQWTGTCLAFSRADYARARLDSHQRTKDFWTNAYVLTTKDDSLNKAHVRYLEARLIAIAATTGSVRLDNGTAPSVP